MSQPVLPRNIIFDTIQATHADIVLADQWITAKTSTSGQEKICKYLNIASELNQVKVAEVSQVTTLTPVGTTASIAYGIVIRQWLGTAIGFKSFPIPITTPATGTISATTISAQFIAAVNANTVIKVTASGSATVVLTADAGYPFFYVTIVRTGLGLTQAATTAGVAARGLAANVTGAGGVLNTAGVAFTGTAYTQWQLKYFQDLSEGNTLGQRQLQLVNIWLNEGATNYAALQAYVLELSKGLPAGGTTYADPEILALQS